MRIAILSDIHANLQALEACVARARERRVDRFVCLGDIVGYGGDPVETLALLRTLPDLRVVRGNHDQAMAAAPDLPEANPIARSVAWTRARLSAADLAFLADLPLVLREDGVTFAHASADRPEEWTYISYPEEVRACLDAAGTPVAFVGHVHVPSLFYESDRQTVRELRPAAGIAVPLSARRRHLVNVGSVGQPRDGRSEASFVVYDAGRREVQFERVIYDFLSAQERIRAAGLPDFFAARLAAGR